MRLSIRNVVLLATVFTIATAAAHAQMYKKISFASPEVAATFDIERAKISSTNCGCFWLKGGTGEASVQLFHGLGAVASFTGEAANIAPGVSLTQYSYMAGPRYTYSTARYTDRYTRKHGPQVFAEALIGGTHATNSEFPSAGGVNSSANSFAVQVGGGAEFAVAHGFGVRPIQVDWIHTALPNNGSNTQNDLRLAFGVTYRFGK